MVQLKKTTPAKRKSLANEGNSAKKAKLENNKVSPKEKPSPKLPQSQPKLTREGQEIENKSKLSRAARCNIRKRENKKRYLEQHSDVVEHKEKSGPQVPVVKEPQAESSDEEVEYPDAEEEVESEVEEEVEAEVEEEEEESNSEEAMTEMEEDEPDYDEEEENNDDDDVVQKAHAPKVNSSDENQCKKTRFILFVRKIPQDATKEDVLQHFAKVDKKYVQFHLATDMSNNQHRGYGFLEVKDKEAFEKCQSLHQSELKGQQIEVLLPHTDRNERKFLLHISSISNSATEEDMMRHFAVVGSDIVSFYLASATSGSIYKQRYGTLEVKNYAAFKKCLLMHQSELKELAFTVRPEKSMHETIMKMPSECDEKYEEKNIVFVSTIPLSATKEDVIELFAEIGDDIVNFNLPVDVKNKDQHRGYGFLEVKNDDAVKKCLSIDNSELKGQIIRVSLPSYKSDKNILDVYIYNIPFEATEADVMEHFAEIGGDIISFRLGRFDNNRSRGRGVLTVKTEEAVKKCLALHNSDFRGRAICVCYGLVNMPKNMRPRHNSMANKNKA